jgi:hypothetical protein
MADNMHRGSYVKVHKARPCGWCGELVKAGTDAYRGVGRFDGEFYDYRMHPECAETMNNDPYVSQDGFIPYENERPQVQEQPQ